MLTWPDVVAIFGLLLFLGWLAFLWCYVVAWRKTKEGRY